MENKLISTVYRQYFDTFFLFLESDLAVFQNRVHVGSLPTSEGEYILFNTEQLSRKNELQRVLDDIKRTSPLEVWDYSMANCLILKEYEIIAKHIPLQIPENFIKFYKNIRSSGITHDIGFSGSINERRLSVLQSLHTNGFSINIVSKWGEERDKELSKCRIHLNIHYEEDYKIFESARCNPWLDVGITIISENSLDNDPRCINVSYEDLVETTINFLKIN